MLEQPAFGRRLRALRVANGLSLSELSGPGMSISYLSRIESGARPPTAKTMEYLAQRLDIASLSLAADKVAPTLSLRLAAVAAGGDADADALREASRRADTDPGSRWQALWLLAELESRHGRRDEERQTLQALVALSDDVQDPELQVRARTRLARCLRSLGDVSGAQHQVHEAVDLATRHELPPAQQARAVMLMVSTEAELGRLHEARAHADDLVDLVADAPNTLYVEALWTASSIRIRQGDHAAAGDLMKAALARLTSREDLTLWARLRLAAAALYLQMQPPCVDEARQCLHEAGPAVELIGTPLHEEEFQLLNATLAFHSGELEQARKAAAQLRETTTHLTFRDRVRLDMLHYRLEILLGDREAAVSGMKELARQAQEATNIDLAAEIWRTLAETVTAA